MSNLVWTLPAQPNQTARWEEPSGGGSQPNAPLYYSFSFAFDDAGLEDGLTVYTPSVGDGTVFLLDAAVIVDEAFDGTTPRVDIGTAVGVDAGIFDTTGYGLVDVSNADVETSGAGIQTGSPANQPMSLTASNGASTSGRVCYCPFTALNPLKLWVSQDGTIGGTPVGGAAGAGRLVFAIVTPTVVT